MAKQLSPKETRDHFRAWQCRVRQVAVREDGGRPSPGMRPRVLDVRGRELAPALTVLLIPKKPEESTAFFRFQVMRTADPHDIYERAVAYLQAEYFHRPQTFSDKILAVLSPGAALANSLLDDGACVLEFEQGPQRFRIPCKTRELERGDASREAAIWHNRLFNPALPDAAQVIAFKPDWTAARTDASPHDRRPD
jgi:hypothetical protein